MRKHLRLTLAAACAGFGLSPADDAKKIVAQLDTEYLAAVKKNDVATMDRILADDFVLVVARGEFRRRRIY